MTPTSGIERTFIDAMPEWTFRLFRPVLLATRDLPWYCDATAKRSNRDNMMEIKAQQFVTSTGRQVLTDNGQQGMAAWRVSVPRLKSIRGAWRKRFLRTARNWITTSLTRSSSGFGSISAECHYQAAQAAFFTPLV